MKKTNIYYKIGARDWGSFCVTYSKEDADRERQSLKLLGFVGTYINKKKGESALSDYN